MKVAKDLTALDYLAEAHTHTKFVREAIAAAQRELPGQTGDLLQEGVRVLYEDAYRMQQNIAVFSRLVKRETQDDAAGTADNPAK